MAKIPKNLSDKSMFGNFAEQITFENDIFQEESSAPLKHCGAAAV